MFNFIKKPLFLFGIILIILSISMIWYNGSSVEGFTVNDNVPFYPNKPLTVIDESWETSEGGNFKVLFDKKTGNLVLFNTDDSVVIVIYRFLRIEFYSNDTHSAEHVLELNNDGSPNKTYTYFTIRGTNKALTYVSTENNTFIFAATESNGTFNYNTMLFNDIDNIEMVATPTLINDVPLISGTVIADGTYYSEERVSNGVSSVRTQKLFDGINYDISSRKIITNSSECIKDYTIELNINKDVLFTSGNILKLKINGDVPSEMVDIDLTNIAGKTTQISKTMNLGILKDVELFLTDSNGKKSVEVGNLGEITITVDGVAYNGAIVVSGADVSSQTIKSTIVSEMPGKSAIEVHKIVGQNNTLVSSIITHNNVKVLAMTFNTFTVLAMISLSTSGEKTFAVVRYNGSNKIDVEPTPEDDSNEEAEAEDEEESEDHTDSINSEYWKWFHYWNKDGTNQPMSQDYMLKTEYVPTVCTSCNAGSCGSGGTCSNNNCCGESSGGNGNNNGGNGNNNGGNGNNNGGNGNNNGGNGNNNGGNGNNNRGISGVANNLIDETGDLTGRVIDTGSDAVRGGVSLGSDAVRGGVDLGSDVLRSGVDLGSDAVRGGVDLGREVTSGALGVGRDIIGGVLGLGRDVVGGTVDVGRDTARGTANFLKGDYSKSGGYANGGNGIETNKYLRGQRSINRTGPYTYNGALSTRATSNFMPRTADFSSF